MMAPGIDMSDRNAWDDSLLINSWNDAVKEYDKYHSIHKSGKRLEEALTVEELKELREDYGEYLEEPETPAGLAAETNGHADHADTDMSHAETGNAEAVNVQRQNPNPSQQQQAQPAGVEDPARQEAAPASAMPQALLGTVQDENMKNIMMSWYYAGYYTGLHAGQQQVPKSTPPNQ
ncbi:hypothetical protein DE146DRAFT_160818 [Phaeosphaeria sp. MPI-PUGE-AT-0046c]|nr:hypothetical protein DE146DRAFT_160818 [Phaeosphaeria sp. MPI-PUGE-AT-0046c]